MHRLRFGGSDTGDVRQGLLTAARRSASRSGPVRGWDASLRRVGWWLLPLAAAGLLAGLGGCSAAGRAGAAHSSAVGAVRSAPASSSDTPMPIPGRWYLLAKGRPLAIDGPAAASALFEPWTVQTHVSAMVSIASTLYLAVNGWGLVALPKPGATLAPDASANFREFEDRRLFGERTINGMAVESGTVILHLYRNTVFVTRAPKSPPVTYVRIDPAVGRMTPVVLRPSHDGWEAAGVVTTARGRWAMAWKKTSLKTVEFRYVLFNPADGKSATIDREAFLAAYGFIPISAAPKAIRRLSRLAASLATPPGSAGTEVAQVVHILLRSAPFDRTRRYTEGPEAALAAGDATLVVVRSIQVDKRIYALVSGGRILRSGGVASNAPPQQALLPALPAGYTYTDIWTDGRTLVATWEQQSFTLVGAAGIYLVAVDDLAWREA